LLDPDVVCDEALAMRVYVRDNKHLFLDPETKRLRMTGPGSIFGSLFSRSDVASKCISNILHIADYMNSFMFQSCNGERAGSHINIVKSKGRASLGEEGFNADVFNTINMPHIHEIDFERIVDKWIAEGRKYATTDNGAESRVIARQRAATTDTFLYK
jgi:hypothetical protein